VFPAGSVREVSRPVAHFTPAAGWINDPYGVWWDGERYHLYFQAVPHGTEWAAEISWGHAVSPDLVRWHERPTALSPGAGEVGCWSGCAVPGPGGRPIAFYTSVREPDLERGSIAVVSLDADGVAAETPRTVIEGPPDGLDVVAFRDPFVAGGPGRWEMAVGAGRADGSGCVLRYVSSDLLRWRFAGVLHAGLAEPPGGGRQAWECPQLVELDGGDVLIVSVQADGLAGPVVAATRPRGGAFGEWRRLVHGEIGYATSAFRDRDGRACLLSWLRDPEARPGGSWTGAESLVGLLAVDAGGVPVVTPHPALEPSGAFAEIRPDSWPAVLDLAGEEGRPQVLSAGPDTPVDLRLVSGGRQVLRARRISDSGALAVELAGRGADELPARDPRQPFACFLDADLVEIFWAGSYGAWRLPR
jgi:beta-fructofuranosidase